MRENSIKRFIFISNPFYIISAACVLYAIYALLNSDGDDKIASWKVTGILMGYTSSLNLVALILIRMKKVWEDSRTLVVLTFLLLLVTPMLMDEFLIKNLEHSTTILHIYFVFLIANVKLFFYFSKIKLPFIFHLSTDISLAIYIYYPHLMMTYLLAPNKNLSILLIYIFPYLMALPSILGLSCFKSIGAGMVNPTPWKVPWNPWLIYFLLLLCIPFKTYSILMVYVPGNALQPEYCFTFMMPVMSVFAWLFLEIGLLKQQGRYFKLFWMSLFLGFGLTLVPLEAEHSMKSLRRVYENFGFSNIGLAALQCCLFSAYALFRRVPKSNRYFLLSLILISMCRLDTYSLSTLHQPYLLLISLAMFMIVVLLYKRWNSRVCFVGVCLMYYLLFQFLIPFENSLWNVSMNSLLLFMTLLVVCYVSKDRFSLYLEYATAMFYPVLLYLNILCFENSEWNFKAQLCFMFLSALLILWYSLNKKNVVLIYAFLLSWLIHIGYHSYTFLKTGEFPEVNNNLLTLYLGVVSLFLAVLISFTKAEIINFKSLFRLFKRGYLAYLVLQRHTFNRKINYLTAFFPICVYGIVLVFVYQGLVSLDP